MRDQERQGSVIIAAIQRKGGAAKTTTIVNLAGELHACGYDVAVVDADPQGSAAAWAEEGRLGFPVVSLPQWMGHPESDVCMARRITTGSSVA